jgi:TolB-like protein/Tfp pilus assembly protein PilF
MFTDMVGYTSLTQSNEPLALSLLQTQEGILLPLIRTHGGTPVKTIGDAHLAEFDSALEAVRCAVEIQWKLREYNKSASPRERFMLRVGIHVGDVVHKDNDVFGDAVNIASRLEPLAEPGGVCISQQAYDQVHNKVEFRMEKLPFHELKNVSSRIEAYKVVQEESPRNTAFENEMPKERVAVLPLSNFSPSPQDEYLADGMTEELITAISGVEGLRVIARTSVMRFKNKETGIAEIGRTLNAGTILEGSFRKIGERIRVTVQLIDARTEEHKWASNYDGDMKDIFSIQSDIANKVAQALEVRLLERRVAAPKSVNMEAYELYLKGRQYWNRRNPEGVAQALKLFKSSAEKDPEFAKAYSGIADCYSIGKGLQIFKREEADPLAQAAIKKAIELDDTVAEAHASRGLLLNDDRRYTAAEEEFKRALSLNPSYASAHHWYTICLANLGKLDEAIEEAKLASQSDPLSAPARNILGVMYTYARQYDKALEVFDAILKLDPEFAPTLGSRSNVFAYMGKEEESMADFNRSFHAASDYDRSSTMAYQLAWFGHKEEAMRNFEEAKRLAPSPESLVSLHAVLCACLGDSDGFFKWADKAIASGDIHPDEVRYAPWLDKVRLDPRYEDVLRRLPS